MDKLKKIMLTILIFCLIILFLRIYYIYDITHVNTFIDDSKTNYIYQELEDILNEKNILENKSFDYNKSIQLFYLQEIKPNFIYSENFDCKYWSYVWATYLYENNLNFEFIMTENHIFVMHYHNKGYYILDNNEFFDVIAN